MQYRPEIDGLRAVAVLPVILFHAGFSVFSGGYIGVDVFFVISGYLITSIILTEKTNGTFALRNFYERRARRILPALFFIMFCCFCVAWFWLLPKRFDTFARSAVAVSLFLANFHFLKDVDYFDPKAENEPLLHTWSLAVEEQYYIFFPLLIMAFWRFGRNPLFYGLCALTIASLALSEWGSRVVPKDNFYLLPFRAWELLIGSLAAFWAFQKPQHHSQSLSLLGLTLIIGSMILYTEDTPIPSVYGLAPVLGTTLILLFGTSSTWVGRGLALKPLVGIGLISYSAYLWHQPLFAFARQISLTEPSYGIMMGLAVMSLVLAALTWAFVENPFRRKTRRWLPKQSQVFKVSALASLVFIAFGVYGYKSDGIPSRLPAKVLTILEIKNEKGLLHKPCLAVPKQDISHPMAKCMTTDTIENGVILIGDSHSTAISGPIYTHLKEAQIPFYHGGYISCVPFSGFVRDTTRSGFDCNSYMEDLYKYANQEDFTTYILSARWGAIAKGDEYNAHLGPNTQKKSVLFDVTNPSAFEDNTQPLDRILASYKARIMDLLNTGKNVILVYPVPESDWDIVHQGAKLVMHNKDIPDLTSDYGVYKTRNAEVLALFDTLQHPNLYHIKPSDTLCDTFVRDECAHKIGSQYLYRDSGHLTNAGAALIAPEILSILDRLNAP